MNTNKETLVAKQKEIMINALETNFGNVSNAAKLAKIAPRTHYRWVKEDDEYNSQVFWMKNVSHEKVRDTVLEAALKKIEKGDSTVLNQLLRIYLKKAPEEMEMISRTVNPLPIRAVIRWVDTPQDPRRTDYKKEE